MMIGRNNHGLEKVLGAKGLIFPEEFMKKLGIDENQLCVLKDIYREIVLRKDPAPISKFLNGLSQDKQSLWKRATAYLSRTQPPGVSLQHYTGVAFAMKPRIWGEYWITGDPNKILQWGDHSLVELREPYSSMIKYRLSREGKKYHLDSDIKRVSRKFYSFAEESIVLSFIRKNITNHRSDVMVSLALDSSVPSKIVSALTKCYILSENMEILCEANIDKYDSPSI